MRSNVRHRAATVALVGAAAFVAAPIAAGSGDGVASAPEFVRDPIALQTGTSVGKYGKPNVTVVFRLDRNLPRRNAGRGRIDALLQVNDKTSPEVVAGLGASYGARRSAHCFAGSAPVRGARPGKALRLRLLVGDGHSPIGEVRTRHSVRATAVVHAIEGPAGRAIARAARSLGCGR